MTIKQYIKREKLLKREMTGNASALWVTILTVINIILYAIGADITFLISARIPSLLGMIGVAILTSPFYVISSISAEALTNEFAVTVIALAVVCISLYFLCWLFGKKHFGWRIAALVMYITDTAFILFELISGNIIMIIDIAFHALILYEMIAGISAHNKLKTMPDDELLPEVQDLSGKQ